MFPDNCKPEAHNPGTVTLSGEGPWTVSLEGVFTDEDSMESAIVKTVTGVSDPEAFEAKIVNGDLVVTPIDLNGHENASVDIKANSNGEIVTLTLELKFMSSGVSSIRNDDSNGEPIYFSLSGMRLKTRPSASGIYLKKEGNKVQKIIIIEQ